MLIPIPFPALLRRMDAEFHAFGSLFDFPSKKWHRPPLDMDWSAMHGGAMLANPLGMAAGPHTQLAQNMVLAYLGGARFMELKTVQVLDRLKIPRPCMHIPHYGLNVEWSQELSLEQSTEEYVKTFWILECLKQEGAYGQLQGDLRFALDISAGYDLAGLQAPTMTRFLDQVQNPEPLLNQLSRLARESGSHWQHAPKGPLSRGVTLSTFHGCPPQEIEAMATLLLERGFHVTLKLNPTLLGLEDVRQILHHDLGYEHLHLDPQSFASDLSYPAALDLLARLGARAADLGRQLGVKLTNTLVVQSDPSLFPTHEGPHMYLSGPPLHVLAMELLRRIHHDTHGQYPTSFSAGIDARNFPDAVACGLRPVTVCTDILKTGGYTRLPKYLSSLEKAMRQAGTENLNRFVGCARQSVTGESTPENGGSVGSQVATCTSCTTRQPRPHLDMRIASVAQEVRRMARYSREKNAAYPKKKGPELARDTCLNCNICIHVCPNHALFPFHLAPQDCEALDIPTPQQIGVLADVCNACGNCELYCPQFGAPFSIKTRFALSREAWEAEPECVFFDGNSLHAALNQSRGSLTYLNRDASPAATGTTPGNTELETRMNALWRAIYDENNPNRCALGTMIDVSRPGVDRD